MSARITGIRPAGVKLATTTEIDSVRTALAVHADARSIEHDPNPRTRWARVWSKVRGMRAGVHDEGTDVCVSLISVEPLKLEECLTIVHEFVVRKVVDGEWWE